MTQRKAETENVKSSNISDRGMYQTRCNFSVLSNYILFVIFIAQTVAYIYYYATGEVDCPEDDDSCICYANHFSKKPT